MYLYILKNINYFLLKLLLINFLLNVTFYLINYKWGLGIGDWGFGVWGLGA